MATRDLTVGPVTGRPGDTLYLPFDVPDGASLVVVHLTDTAGAGVGLGLFDDRGPGWQSPGFRGIYGAERRRLFVAADEASPAFRPGTVRPGRWTVVVPIFHCPAETTDVTARVTLSFGPQRPPAFPGPAQGVVVDRPGWYRGDLHCHTPASSDAWAMGTALSPSAWAEVARAVGMDFLALTDHNVVTQNNDVVAAAGGGVLLLPGEEMTAWGHGHATVSGIDPGAWLDWRIAPADQAKPLHGGRLKDFLQVAHNLGAYVSAAHPFCERKAWRFFGDMAADPAARTDGIEVWSGRWDDDDERALATWDEQLRAGVRVVANGGSDLHGLINPDGILPGTPTTVVWADRLERRAIVEALRRGRSFVTSSPAGVEVYLSASGPDKQRDVVGGAIHGESGEAVELEALVRRGAGTTLRLWSAGAAVFEAELSEDEQVVQTSVAVPAGGGYVRAEVRRERAMEAVTNPIWLVDLPAPPGKTPIVAPPRRW